MRVMAAMIFGLIGVLINGFGWSALAQARLTLVHDPYPPYVDENRPGFGLAADIAVSILARAGYPSTVTLVPWARALQGTQKGTYDALLSAWYSEERNQTLAFSAPYAVNRIKFILLVNTPFRFRTLQDLAGREIAVVRGYAYRPDFDAATNLQKTEVNEVETALRMLLAGRVELALEEERVAQDVIARQMSAQAKYFVFSPETLSENTMQMAVSRTRSDAAEIVKAFNQALATMKIDGSLAEIYRRQGFHVEREMN